MKPSGTITAFLLDLFAVLPVEAEAEDVPEEAAPPQPQTACVSSMADKRKHISRSWLFCTLLSAAGDICT